MKKRQFKEVYSWVRKIKNARYGGTHGYLSDISDKYNLPMSLLREIYDMNNKPKKLIYGKYTRKYIDNQNAIADLEAYGERLWRA